jgi:hypothetical protein
MRRCHGNLHYNRKFQIFIFLIGYINVNKGVFCFKTAEQNIKVCKVTDEKPEVHLITNSLQFDDLVFKEMLNLFKSNSILGNENMIKHEIY